MWPPFNMKMYAKQYTWVQPVYSSEKNKKEKGLTK